MKMKMAFVASNDFLLAFEMQILLTAGKDQRSEAAAAWKFGSPGSCFAAASAAAQLLT